MSSKRHEIEMAWVFSMLSLSTLLIQHKEVITGMRYAPKSILYIKTVYIS